jgi:hypothetical protein
MLPSFHIYPTLLDSFGWYKRSENEGAKQEFLNKINRVPMEKTDAMIRGNDFEAAVNEWSRRGRLPDGPVTVHDLTVSPELIGRFSKGMERAMRQVFVEVNLETKYGGVRLYGFIDDILADAAYDTKTTGEYKLGKYRNGWQHPAYLEALHQGGGQISRFVYRITDFEDYYEEEYQYRKEDTERLVKELEHLIEFLEDNRAAISDRKIFTMVSRDKVTR